MYIFVRCTYKNKRFISIYINTNNFSHLIVTCLQGWLLYITAYIGLFCKVRLAGLLVTVKKVYNLDASIMKNRPGMLKIITPFTHTHIYMLQIAKQSNQIYV